MSAQARPCQITLKFCDSRLEKGEYMLVMQTLNFGSSSQINPFVKPALRLLYQPKGCSVHTSTRITNNIFTARHFVQPLWSKMLMVCVSR